MLYWPVQEGTIYLDFIDRVMASHEYACIISGHMTLPRILVLVPVIVCIWLTPPIMSHGECSRHVLRRGSIYRTGESAVVHAPPAIRHDGSVQPFHMAISLRLLTRYITYLDQFFVDWQVDFSYVVNNFLSLAKVYMCYDYVCIVDMCTN